MYTLIILFYIALLGMIVMLLLKRHEVHTGKQSLMSRLGRGSDHIFQGLFYSFRKAASYLNRKTLIALVQWIAYHVLLRVRRIYVEAKDRALANPHSRKVIDAVRGRGEVTRHGASFYLRRISDK